MEFVEGKNIVPPAGHYSPAVKMGNIMWVSGQLPIHPKTGCIAEGGLEGQAKQVFANLEAILECAGMKKEDVMKTTVYIPDISLWGEINELYAEFFGSHKPSRSVVPTGNLHLGALLEMEAFVCCKEE